MITQCWYSTRDIVRYQGVLGVVNSVSDLSQEHYWVELLFAPEQRNEWKRWCESRRHRPFSTGKELHYSQLECVLRYVNYCNIPYGDQLVSTTAKGLTPWTKSPDHDRKHMVRGVRGFPDPESLYVTPIHRSVELGCSASMLMGPHWQRKYGTPFVRGVVNKILGAGLIGMKLDPFFDRLEPGYSHGIQRYIGEIFPSDIDTSLTLHDDLLEETEIHVPRFDELIL